MIWRFGAEVELRRWANVNWFTDPQTHNLIHSTTLDRPARNQANQELQRFAALDDILRSSIPAAEP